MGYRRRVGQRPERFRSLHPRATVGFGDITPVTGTARVLTMVQMLADVILVGMIARILLGAVRIAEEARSVGSGEPPGAEDPVGQG
ncbi:potassium channel family protein [Streptomyces sp. NBC_00878]|uniref:potassium channel family protein n=1 Tax=Streptomyces sp. NBC_00878 TaxID=2975854 RepID=UPI002259BA5A|nr:potassium channel family protein [Streptomyces sp. NBC_00878]MCX4906348.1 potassium channel family protein [Streptomyces sp. NBC_00878]